MKIAITAPPWISIPPQGYGGIERVVWNLVEGFKQKGHDITLYSTGDSTTLSHLEYYYPHALGNNFHLKLNPYLLLNHMYHFYKNAKNRFDIVHENMGETALYFADLTNTPIVMTLHGPLRDNAMDLFKEYGTLNAARDLLLRFKHVPYVSISDKQREGLPELNYVKTIYNSLVISEFDYNSEGGTDMVWVGRVNYTKGVDIGIQIAKKMKKNLHLSSYIDTGDLPYFKKEIEPHFSKGFITHNGELSDIKAKSTFLGNSRLFLFPIRWDEPFGIVMIEAMATGTPLVSFALGSAPEVIQDGETGFLVNFSDTDIRGNWIIKKTGIEGMCEAIERIYTMPETRYKHMRKACREHVEKNFTVQVMVNAYEQVYEQIISLKK